MSSGKIGGQRLLDAIVEEHMYILDILPNGIKQHLLESIVGVLIQQAEQHGGEKIITVLQQLSGQVAFTKAFDAAMESALERFIAEYTEEDEDLVAAILADITFWLA
jgi:hypothetical protein